MGHMSDPLPMHESQHSFDVVLRGYDRHQVAETIERLEADFRIALADRDAANARSADMAGQLQGMHAEIEQLRRKAATASAPTFENISERIQHMLQLAEEEAAEIRRVAETDAQAVREQTAAEERAMLERHAAGQAEVERMLAEARQNAEQIAQKAQIRADELVAKAQERVARLDAESQARRAKAEEDFEIALRARRAEAQRQEEERERVSTEAARQRIAQAEEHAARIVADGEARAAAIRDVRDELTSRLHQARQLLSTLPDLSDRPQQAAPARPQAAPAQPADIAPPTQTITVARPAAQDDAEESRAGEAAAARQPVRTEPAPAPQAAPPTQPAVQPAPVAERPQPAPRPAEGPGGRLRVPPRPTTGSTASGSTADEDATDEAVQGPPTRVQPAVNPPTQVQPAVKPAAPAQSGTPQR
jgi:cell division septum initiation protein DivIVA